MAGKAFVLLSGGIDSTTCLYIAMLEFDEVEAISIFYGQRHRKEIQYAQETCQMLEVPHRTLDISGVIPATMLTDPAIAIPNLSYADITGVSPTYVPFRNGLLLSSATSHVVGRRRETAVHRHEEWAIYFGAHAEDAAGWAYPDCTFEFTGAMANAIRIGTYDEIRLRVPLQFMTKEQIIRHGDDLNVDWTLTWSCYAGGDLHCGTCPTCRARRDGFEAANVVDHTEYACDSAAESLQRAP